MEITVELDESLVDELDEEAQLQGFDDRGAYLRWIIANRPMSELATSQAPAVASRVSELEERMKLVERQLDLSAPTDAAADLGDDTVTPSGGDLADGGGSASLEDPGDGPAPDETGGGGELEEPPDADPVDLDIDDEPDEDEEAAEDDDIAEAVDSISLEDEDDEED